MRKREIRAQRKDAQNRDWLQQRDDEVDDKDVPIDEHQERDEYDRLAREFRG